MADAYAKVLKKLVLAGKGIFGLAKTVAQLSSEDKRLRTQLSDTGTTVRPVGVIYEAWEQEVVGETRCLTCLGKGEWSRALDLKQRRILPEASARWMRPSSRDGMWRRRSSFDGLLVLLCNSINSH